MGRPRGDGIAGNGDESRLTIRARKERARELRFGKELAKREQLAAALRHELATPLTPGVALTRKERARVIERVRTGISAQSFYAKGGSVSTKMGDL